jgi:hypothetical protein
VAGGRLVFAGQAGGRWVVAEEAPVERVLGVAPADATGLTAPVAVPGGVLVGVALADGRSLLWQLGANQKDAFRPVAGTVTAVASVARTVWWATAAPPMLYERSGSMVRRWPLPSDPLALATSGHTVLALLHQPLDPPATGSLLARVAGSELTFLGVPAPVLPPASAPWQGGAASLVMAGQHAWSVLYRSSPRDVLVVRADVEATNPAYLTSLLTPAVPSAISPRFPVFVNARLVAAGLGNRLVIAERPVAARQGWP